MDIILAAAWIMSFFYLLQKIMKLKKMLRLYFAYAYNNTFNRLPQKDLSVDKLSVEAVFDEKSGQYILFKKEK